MRGRGEECIESLVALSLIQASSHNPPKQTAFPYTQEAHRGPTARKNPSEQTGIIHISRAVHTVMRTCPHCKAPFESDVPTKRYCTLRCRRRAHDLRKYHRGARKSYQRGGGYVYLMQEGDDGPVKIGWAKNPATRIEDFQTGNSRELRIVASFPGGINDERELHKRFAAHRIRGEWFRPVPEMFDLLELA